MNILIVHAHHESKSFCSALKDNAVETFTRNGHVVQVSDLYKMNFKAIADRTDFHIKADPTYLKYQAEQVNAFTQDAFSADIKAEMEKLLWADVLIFNFPLWWFSVPAILKGWVDRVFAMGFAYGAGKGVYESGVFKGKKGMLCITTGGPEISYDANGKNGEIEKILFPINHGMIYFVGMDVLQPFVAFSPARITEEERKIYLDKYTTRLSNLFEEKPISF